MHIIHFIRFIIIDFIIFFAHNKFYCTHINQCSKFPASDKRRLKPIALLIIYGEVVDGQFVMCVVAPVLSIWSGSMQNLLTKHRMTNVFDSIIPVEAIAEKSDLNFSL